MCFSFYFSALNIHNTILNLKNSLIFCNTQTDITNELCHDRNQTYTCYKQVHIHLYMYMTD